LEVLLADLQTRDANPGEVVAETDRLSADEGSRISDEGQTDKVAEIFWSHIYMYMLSSH